MIFNTTYVNKDYDFHKFKQVGGAFSLIEKIRMCGVGSSRFMISAISEKLNPNKQAKLAIDYGNIELRKKGIIVHFTFKQERFSWLIPYYRLVIYNASYFTIHSNGNFIRFRKNKNYNNNKKFINKMIDLKNKTLNLSYYDG